MRIGSYDTLSSLMLYTFDLPLFFFISGFLAYKATMSISDIGKAIKKKFVLLVMPALAFSIAYNLLYHKDVLSPLYKGFGLYWFTISLFECFLIYYAVLLLVKNQTQRNVTLVLLSLVSIGLLSVFSEFGPGILDFNHLFKYFYFFVIGIFAKEYKSFYDKLIRSELFKGFSIVVFFVLLFIIDYEFWPNVVFRFTRDIVLRVLGTAVVVSFFVTHSSFFEKKNKINTVVGEIGKKSLAIYLLQYFFIPNFSAYPEWLHGLDQFNVHLVSGIYTIFITITCFIFIYLLEQSRFVKKYILGLK